MTVPIAVVVCWKAFPCHRFRMGHWGNAPLSTQHELTLEDQTSLCTAAQNGKRNHGNAPATFT